MSEGDHVDMKFGNNSPREWVYLKCIFEATDEPDKPIPCERIRSPLFTSPYVNLLY